MTWPSFYDKVLLLLHIDSWLLLFLSQYKQIDEIANKVQLVPLPISENAGLLAYLKSRSAL